MIHLKSVANKNRGYEYERTSNGRMRSFVKEEVEEEQYLRVNEIYDSRSEQLGQKITDKLASIQMKTKPIRNNTYLYPIFHYQLLSELKDNLTDESDYGNFSREDSVNNINNISQLIQSHDTIFPNKNIPRKSVEPNHEMINSQKIQLIDNYNSSYNNLTTINNSMIDYSNGSVIKEKEILNDSKKYNMIENFTQKMFTESYLENTHKNYSKENMINNEGYSSISGQYYSEVSKNSTNIDLNLISNTSERFCMTSTDCSMELNERCLVRTKYSICGCKDPFFREIVSKQCQIKKLIRLIFKISSFNYSIEMNNSNSFEFIQTKHLIERSIWSVIINSSQLLKIIDDIKVIQFSPFSVRIDFYVKIANPTNDFHHKYLEYHFWYSLMSVIKGIHINKNTNDLKAVEIDNNIKYCSIDKLNYCSENSICMENNETDSKYECKCKNGLNDLSPNPKYSGEICSVKCNFDFCGSGGFCQIINGTHFHCVCINWSFGSRCQYSSHVLLSICAFLILFFILFAFCSASFYCGQKIQTEFNNLRSIVQKRSSLENSLGII